VHLLVEKKKKSGFLEQKITKRGRKECRRAGGEKGIAG